LIATQSGVRLAKVIPEGKLPPVLCLDKQYEQTVGFIHDLRIRTNKLPSPAVRQQMIKHSGRIGWIRNYQDFKSLTEISAGAALLLAAEYDRARAFGGLQVAAIDVEGWNPRVYATFSMLGFFDLFKLPQDSTEDIIDGFHIEPLTSGIAANSQPALDRIVDLFERAGGNNATRVALSGAIVDALENVKQHAYPQDHFVGIRHVPNWWFTGASNEQHRFVTLAVYDQGITIPVSLPRRFGMDRVVSAFRSWFNLPFDPINPQQDGAALEAAMRLSATSTAEHFRGKGLAKIKDAVQRCGGQLRIVSRNGEYIFTAGSAQTKTHPVGLPGTYVEVAALF
jgi:hypothetical protein